MGVGEQKAVIFSEKAKIELNQIGDYITEKGYPETGYNYSRRIFELCLTLGTMPEKYPICRHKRFNRWNYHCAIFEQTYTIVYKIDAQVVTVKRILHGKLLK